MIKQLSLPTRKRRFGTRPVSKAPPFLAAALVAALLLSQVHSFSIRNHIITPVISGPANIDNTLLPSRLESTSLPYLNYDLDFGLNDSISLEESEEKSPHRFSKRTSRRKSFSSEDNWQGLSNVMDSTSSGFALGYSLFVPKGVSVSFFTTGTSRTKPSPLVVTPDRKTRHLGDAAKKDSLHNFLKTYQKWVDERILEYGGIVFRDFGSGDDTKGINESIATGKEILRAFGNDSSGLRKGFDYYLVSDDDSKTLQHSSIEQRIDLSSRRGSQPLRLSKIGTQTKITDWRGIHGDLSLTLQRKLDEKQLLYKRTDLVKKNLSRYPFDKGEQRVIGATTPWLELYGSTNKRVFERSYNNFFEKPMYLPKESEFVCEAFRRHPQSNQKIWFELAHRFHWTSLPAQLISELKYTKNPWKLVKAIRAVSVGLWKKLRRRNNDLPLTSGQRHQQEHDKITVAFGDGTPISWWEMHQIRRAINKNTAQFSWKPGDILVVDGLSLGVQ